MRLKLSENISKLAIISIVLGLFFSNALKSIGMVALAASVALHPDSLKNIRWLLKDKLFISSIGIAAFYLMAFLYGGNYFYYWLSIKNKILYFFVPLALVNTSLKKNELRLLGFLFFACAFIQSVYAVSYLFFDGTAIGLYSTGQVLPTLKINHIEISWLTSMAVLLVIIGVEETNDTLEKIILSILGLWFFIFLHVFAVRTGLVALYIFLSLFSIYKILKRFGGKYIFIIPFILSGIFFTSYLLSENLRQKVNYTLYDLSKFKGDNKELQYYSDSRRMVSFKVGLKIIKENPLVGCGVGNIKDACEQIYKRDYPFMLPENYYRPHSWFIYVYASFGVFMGVLIMSCFLYPLLYFIRANNLFFFCLYVSVVIISLWDVIMATLFGECIYLLLIGWGIKREQE